VDSTGDTIDFLLSWKRNAAAAKRFFHKALRSPNHPRPPVVIVDKNPAYPKAIEELKGHWRSRPALPLSTCSLSQQHS
jgi:transposase-like protein